MPRTSARAWAGPLSRGLNGAIWVFHGLYSKLLGGVPRHRLIVARILGPGLARPATFAIGLGEIALGLWILLGRHRKATAALQTALLIAMNALELRYARDLLLAPLPMVAANAGLIALAWMGALQRPDPGTAAS